MRQDITIADGTVVHTLDAFPFDSSPNLVTTEQGYRRGDRAVDAWTMQRTFAQFFSDGVFGTPADAFQIAKAASGLAVTIQPGMAVIQGAMGGIKESDGALTVTLDTAAAAGNVCYGIMLRYDNNSDVRSLGIRVVKGVAGSNPQPPAPDTTSAGVMELRLGYVTVPNGATDLSNATVTNEKGLSVCPYAAPFEEIDMSEVTADARASANEALTELLAYFESNREAIDAALSGEEATYLQQQITAIQEQLANTDLSGSVDNVTVEYAIKAGDVEAKLRVKDGGIGTEQVADGAVTEDKIEPTLMSHLEWATAAGSRQTGNIPVSSLSGPTWESMGSLLDPSGAETLWTGSWANGSITVSGLSGYRVLYVEGIRKSAISEQFRGFAYVLDDCIEGTIPYSSTSYSGVALVLILRSGDSLTGRFYESSQYTPAVLMQFETQYSVPCTINTIKGVF